MRTFQTAGSLLPSCAILCRSTGRRWRPYLAVSCTALGKALTIKTILTALALKSGDDPVAGRTAQLAEQHGARLIVLHVTEGSTLDEVLLPPPVEQEKVARILDAEAGDRLRVGFEIQASLAMRRTSDRPPRSGPFGMLV